MTRRDRMTAFADNLGTIAYNRVYNRAENDYVRQGSNMTRAEASRRIAAPRIAMRRNPISEYNNRHFVSVRNPRTGQDVRPVRYNGDQALVNANRRSRSRTAVQKRVNDITGVTQFSRKSIDARADRMYQAVNTFARAGYFSQPQPTGGSTSNS